MGNAISKYLSAPLAAARRFFCEPASPLPLGVFRVGVALIALAQIALLWPYAQQLYGNFGLVQWAIMELGSAVWLPSIGKLALFADGFGIASTTVVHLVFGAFALSLVGLLIGWKARAFGAAAWAIHSLMVNSGYMSLYGVDTMLHICLFYLAWMPSGGALTLRHLRSGRVEDAPSFGARISLRVLQLHLCIIYVNTSVAKMSGAQWWTGEAIWRALMEPQFAVFDMAWLARVPWLAAIICWGVLLVEAGYVFFVWPRRTRGLWVAATVGLHLGIGVFMGLWLFSLVMVLLTFSGFGAELVAAAWRETASRGRERSGGASEALSS